LFSDDIRVIVANNQTDGIFYIITLICFGIFIIEIALSCYAKDDYLNSFFFYLDLISTLTLLMDVGWVSDPIFGSNSSSTSAVAAKVGSKATRVIRIIRLIRLIRIVKFYKMAQQHRDKKKEERRKEYLRQKAAIEKLRQEKLAMLANQPSNLREVNQLASNDSSPKAAGRNMERFSVLATPSLNPLGTVPNPALGEVISRNESKLSQSSGGLHDFSDLSREVDAAEDDSDATFKESNVNKTLTNNINKIVIILILLIMLSVPLFNVDTYVNENYDAPTAGFYQIQRLISRTPNPILDKTFNRVYKFFESTSTPVIYQYIAVYSDDGTSKVEKELGNKKDIDNYRASETLLQSTDQLVEDRSLVIYFKNRFPAVLGAWLGIGRTLFVCIILTVSILVLSRDTENLVLNPLEEMIKKISKISKNPLDAAEIEEKERAENLEIKQHNPKLWAKIKETNSYEPAVLEKIVIKIGTLLAIGFGEAGSEIIAKNMEFSGSVNPMIEGKKIVAIFGFCDIRQFSEVTDALKEKIMPFVNRVADIVHSIVNLHQGAANKNIGEAFLLVWRIPDTETVIGDDNQLKTMGGDMTRTLADLSVISFIKVVAGITKSYKLNEMCSSQSIVSYFEGKGYKLNMGFGLHIGWGIEGAIGSKFKIDASYLSPNVNMAARLEAATRQFKQHILISGVLVKYLSPDIAAHLRHIDTVTVKGSIQPVELHTVDLDVARLIVHSEESPRGKMLAGPISRQTSQLGEEPPKSVQDEETLQSRNQKIEERKLRKDLRMDLKRKIKTTAQLLSSDKDFEDMRKSFPKEFFESWKEGFKHYIEGRWEEARVIFEKTKVVYILSRL
jgi:class 3 adenylate cyclase